MERRLKYLIRLKVLYLTEFFDINKMKKENIEKIERCDKLINQQISKQFKN